MDHLEDSLSSDSNPLLRKSRGAPPLPQYDRESPRAKLKFDKYRPQDPQLKKLTKETKALEAKVAQSIFNEHRVNLDK